MFQARPAFELLAPHQQASQFADHNSMLNTPQRIALTDSDTIDPLLETLTSMRLSYCMH